MKKQEAIERSGDAAAVDAVLSLVAKRPLGRVKANRHKFEEPIMALLDEHGEMSIGELHRALYEKLAASYGLIQQIVKELAQSGKLGKVEGWPSRYYRQAAQDGAPATTNTSPREIAAPALGRGRRPWSKIVRYGQEDDLGALEVEVLAVARVFGPCILSDLHAALLQRRDESYSTMLAAVRNLMSHRYLRRRMRQDSRYIYEVRGDEHD